MSETAKKELSQLEGHGLHTPTPQDSGHDTVRQAPADDIYTGQPYASSQKKEEKKENVTRDVSILVLITVAAGVLLGAAYSVTKDPIAKAQAQARAEAQQTVLKDADHFTPVAFSSDEAASQEGQTGSQDPASPETSTGSTSAAGQFTELLEEAGISATDVTAVDLGLDAQDDLIGYVVTSTNSEGYGGDVELMCGITPDGDGKYTIQGISFLTLTETAGMGMRAKDEEFSSQFSGKTITDPDLVVYSRSGAAAENEIDAISGCTITTSAVTKDVNAALLTVRKLADGSSSTPDASSDETSASDPAADSSGDREMETDSSKPSAGSAGDQETETETSAPGSSAAQSEKEAE